MGKLAELLNSTLNTEMALHRSYCAKFGITEKELEGTLPAPTTQAYTRHLLYVAYSGSIGEIAAALLPCQWGYCEIGQNLAAQGEPQQPLYADWVRMYASAEYADLAGWFRGLVDRLAEGAGRDELATMGANYAASARYEYMFWDMAYRMEQWPI